MCVCVCVCTRTYVCSCVHVVQRTWSSGQSPCIEGCASDIIVLHESIPLLLSAAHRDPDVPKGTIEESGVGYRFQVYKRKTTTQR